MLISKFDLYKSGWLELVFENRNKEYGAYQLRQDYAGNIAKAMGFTFSGIILATGLTFLLRGAPVNHYEQDRGLVITLSNTNSVKPPLVVPPRPIAPRVPPRPPVQVRTQQFIPLVVTSDDHVTKTPPDIDELKQQAIGTVTTPGKEAVVGPPVVDPGPASSEGVTESKSDDDIHTLINLEVMPEPVGGESAWNKFLSKNLRFPGQAIDQQVSGRVILSFVVEKDGHLSNIVVERPAGYGFDEEAVRVLKLAKAWKPGIQNGRPVRVKYTFPINFQLTSEQ